MQFFIFRPNVSAWFSRFNFVQNDLHNFHLCLFSRDKISLEKAIFRMRISGIFILVGSSIFIPQTETKIDAAEGILTADEKNVTEIGTDSKTSDVSTTGVRVFYSFGKLILNNFQVDLHFFSKNWVQKLYNRTKISKSRTFILLVWRNR